MAGDEQVSLEITREVARLHRRIDEIETVVARTAAALGSLGVVLGAFLPFATTDEVGSSLAQLPSTLFGQQDDVMRSNLGPLWLLFIGVSGLLVVLLGCLWVFARVWGRKGTQRTARVGGTFAVLAAVGTGVILVIWVLSVFQPDTTSGPAVVLLVVGVLMALVLTKADSGRRLWVEGEVPRVRR